MHCLLLPLVLAVGLAGRAIAECQSSGYDFVDGGGPYCINTTSNDWFSFGTVFQGDEICHMHRDLKLTSTRLSTG